MTINRTKKSHPAKEEKPHLARTERVQLDMFDLCVLQRIVNDMFSKQKTLPTLSNIRTASGENWLHRQQVCTKEAYEEAWFLQQEEQDQQKAADEEG